MCVCVCVCVCVCLSVCVLSIKEEFTYSVHLFCIRASLGVIVFVNSRFFL